MEHGSRSRASAAKRGWQKWGKWKKFNGDKCRTYVDASPSGKRLLVSSQVECGKKHHSMETTLAGKWNTHPFHVIVRGCGQGNAPVKSCYASQYVNNPAGKQRWRVVGLGNLFGIDLPDAVIEFTA